MLSSAGALSSPPTSPSISSANLSSQGLDDVTDEARIDFNEFASLFVKGLVPLTYLDTSVGADDAPAPGGKGGKGGGKDLKGAAARKLQQGHDATHKRKRAMRRSSEGLLSREGHRELLLR